MSSSRAMDADRPFIEDVLDKYSELNGLTMLALGSSYWSPPKKSLEKLQQLDMDVNKIHRYSNILGLNSLRDKLKLRFQSLGLDMATNDLIVTAGANQAFQSTALALCDNGDQAIVLAPYYFSHKLALQLAGVKVSVAPFGSDMLPDWDQLESLIKANKPKMVVMTSPNNPSGKVFSASDVARIVSLCRAADCWLVADQTYYEFLFDGAQHTFPEGYDKIVHIFSFSKAFGMPGWRVGYAIYPKLLTESYRKIQDTIPTHATVLSQHLAELCLDTYHEDGGRWVSDKVASLEAVRQTLWPSLETMNTVRTCGAFYFLVPLPPEVSEEEAVDVLARKFGLLLMPGSAFGAPQHMRLSYGSIPPASAMQAEQQLRAGLQYIAELAAERRK
eukprot:CAMPEP_0201103732 /NCGR_PEP_ID=MMETSP0812-20130820/32007_1 /ASSEMBLY_ACC=CAM_ASM_000668 /TAXON_ID=98059 /ORGANISM="Dinobryon sp., Strain UTEXLB2267" /LENGTH=387 /DNA_ID=CAMNT_0047362303 /DNA_START=86 /DNA_END=1249 /DNA_ORIENTATION=-